MQRIGREPNAPERKWLRALRHSRDSLGMEWSVAAPASLSVSGCRVRLSSHSRVINSKVSPVATLSAFRLALGAVPSAMSFRALVAPFARQLQGNFRVRAE
jgi:hypothetical protein